jgi:hypothetical protein
MLQLRIAFDLRVLPLVRSIHNAILSSSNLHWDVPV